MCPVPKRTASLLMFIATGIFTASAAAQDEAKPEAKPHEHAQQDVPTEGVAKLIPTVGNTVNGIIVLTQKGEDVHVTGEVWNLRPGEHGFHIHEFGDLRSADGASAGGHYNPEGHKHGGPDSEERHPGDMGNITAGNNGRAQVDIMAKGLKLHFVIGRSIVVHGGRDDLQSQPSGNAGPRVAVGVIGFAQVKMSEQQPTEGQAQAEPNQPAEQVGEEPADAAEEQPAAN